MTLLEDLEAAAKFWEHEPQARDRFLRHARRLREEMERNDRACYRSSQALAILTTLKHINGGPSTAESGEACHHETVDFVSDENGARATCVACGADVPVPSETT